MPEDEKESTPRERIMEFLNKYCLTISSEFVPYSKTGKPDESVLKKSLNWVVTVKHAGRALFTTPYSAGIAHAPAYKQKFAFGGVSIDEAKALNYECEHGRQALLRAGGFIDPRKPLEPNPVDVFTCLFSDATAIDHPTFESWAREYGYDEDSRRAEAIYRKCLEIGLALRAALGDKAISEFQDAAHDF